MAQDFLKTGDNKEAITDQRSGSATHAVIIGGGIAGLLSASVLSKSVDKVTILERDIMAVEPGPRPGVPQSTHAHVLVAEGLRIIEQLFPGIWQELLAAGALPGDFCADSIMVFRGSRLLRFNSSLHGLLMSRNLLEWHVRQRIMDVANIELKEGHKVTDLIGDASHQIVQGVQTTSFNGIKNQFSADIVIDASGNHSSAPKWVQALGCDRPVETIVNAFVGYATRRYQRPNPWKEDWKVAASAWWPPNIRCGGVLIPEENDVIAISLIGASPDMPPTDVLGFEEHADNLQDPLIHEVIMSYKPISTITGYHPTGNRRRQYGRSSRGPKRFVAVGDALCAFNPVYGQGMAVAALQAIAMQKLLKRLERPDARSLESLAAKIQRKLERVNRVPWLLSTSEDFRHGDGVEGRMSVLNRVTRWYTDLVLHSQNQIVREAFYETINLTNPYALLKPSVSIRVLLSALRTPYRNSGNRKYQQ